MDRLIGNLPDKDLARLEEASCILMILWKPWNGWRISRNNRDLMMEQIIAAVRDSVEVRPFTTRIRVFNCHHNYVARERH